MNEKKLKILLLQTTLEVLQECWRLSKINPVGVERILTEAVETVLHREKDAEKKTRKAKSPKAARQWSKVANETLKRTGDEGRAVRTANAVVKKRRVEKGEGR